MRSTNGGLILVLGILSFLGFGPLTGVPAWILGNIALHAIRHGQASDAEIGMVQAGRVLGIVNTVLFALGVFIAYFTVRFWTGYFDAVMQEAPR